MDKPVQLIHAGDRVTFDSDEGIQAGYVNDLRRDVGNGQLHALVELDHQWPGMFRAVPVSAILTSDPVGPPSLLHFNVNLTTCEPIAGERLPHGYGYAINMEAAKDLSKPSCSS
ncbi:hypothetical protein ACIPF8_10880 [Collimonas sp. NPDC087041]|uniref:hypothetical protein n=1 Tax=Collimonas sp. NPDC087041 TaxID=3363960 RepID=UPI0037F1A010